MIDSNGLLKNPIALRERLAEKGYLLFRNLIPKEVLMSLRKDFADIFEEKKWIQSFNKQAATFTVNRSPMQEGEEKEGFFEVYDEVMKLERLYALAHQDALLGVMQNVLGESAFPHPLSIARLIFPKNNETTTPPHQDYPNNQGTQNLTATWIPLVDCPQQLGGLAILEGSHKFNEILPLDFHLGAGNRTVILPPKYQQLNWVQTDFQLGDFLIFPALTVHKALDNLTESSMRISVDFRFQLEGEALTENVLKPHFGRFPWSEVYAKWEDTTHQYYWREKKYEVVEWDTSLHHIENFDMADAIKQQTKYKKQRTQRTQSLSTKK